ncbi:ABC transporter ATP-binding protein [Miniphocaeibacter halophilus]|uniref:ABC transporter ATP-binding protein n=1 Tax=Miniphocaeibacter halophilus TaxID=2931922 RepID=A0AC61MQI8_9FIRM|nr:ABC transporter ATP-binding protein [Miniphocaeibacter halophilus]QQK07869.1 ABC transporter ATP-binding protein [Miniphocaeibacter halophilus]
MNILKVDKINKSYDNKKVLNNISMEVEEGDLFGLIGPNGAGKSTLIQIICGLLGQDSGKIELFGMNYKNNSIEIKKRIGLVPQELAIFENLTARDNLEYFGRMYGLKGKVLKERIKEVLELIGLDPKDKKQVQKYSGGMKRRLNLGCSVLHKPDLLILDEPTVGVDAQSRNNIFDYLRKINKEGTTIIYTSHYMEEIEALCNKIFIIDLGEEIAYGEKSELKSMYGSSSILTIYLNKIENGIIEELNLITGVLNSEIEENKIIVKVNKKELNFTSIFKLIENRNLTIENFTIKDSNLEEIFLNLTGKKLRD